jgi:hypothetical protein
MHAKPLLIVLLFALLVPFVILPQAGRPPAADTRQLRRTYGQLNGRAWNTFSEEAKLAFLEGMESAFGTAYGRSLNTPCEQQNALLLDAYRAPGFTQGEQMIALNRFYAEPENLLIGIVDGKEIVAAKTRGVPQQVIDDRISEHRRVANTAPERQ